MRSKTGFAVLLLALASAMGLWADATNGTLYYTTFSGGVNVHRVDYSYNGVTTFTLSGNTGIASTSGADGILFLPDGNLAVAGQGNNLTEVTTGGTIVRTVAPGNPSFHLALNSNAPNALLYNMWNGGGNAQISAVTLSGGGLLNNGVAYTVIGCGGCSTDVRGVILNQTNNTWYYGTAPDGGSGEFGTVVFNDVAHTATLTRLTTGVFAHGLTFDPFSGNVIASSATTVQEFDAAGNVISSVTVAGQQWDQSAVDGKGHLFLASNGGSLTFIDYSSTVGKLIGGAGHFTNTQFLAGSLDDIAPIAGLGGGGQVPEPTSLLLLGSAIAAVAVGLRKRSA